MPTLKYSEFLHKVAKHVVTSKELYHITDVKSSEGFYYSQWICNIISGRDDEHSIKLRKTIKRKLENKKGKGTVATFTITFIPSLDPEENKQYRINWLLTLAKIHESKGN